MVDPPKASLDDLELTEKEQSRTTLRPSLAQEIESFREARGLEKHQMRVLDWGCGRGKLVFLLRDHGYDAYGVDVTAEAIESGNKLARNRGLGRDLLGVLDEKGGSPFPDGFFDFTYSNQVFEHVEDIGRVANELARVMKPGAQGIHIYPAKHVVLERHLRLPFVHWLPKNRLRWALIRALVGLGFHTPPPILRGLSDAVRSERIFRFSCDRTYYRRIGRVCSAFEQAGLRATADSVHSPTVQRHWLLGWFARQRLTAPLLNSILVRFYSVHLVLERRATS